MAYTISIAEAAEQDLREAFKWYAEKQPQLGQRFRDHISDSIQYIQNHPLKFQIRYGRIRVYFMNVFPYGIHYRVRDNHIIIVAVFHTAQNPEHWRNR